ncbi:MOSC domain-containing protein [Actinopolymorpha sp. NPDC004070]|uniref:MOSC domain-containing protein n=1 Tax=Actinopolymorpha sp. NPDC004070 TaxID=3154548 RepID=UPI0033A8F733
MYVARIGLTPVKGMAHEFLPELHLPASGLPGDRAFCFYDVAADRVLRTVDHDALLACHARWVPPRLTITTPVGVAAGDADELGDRLVADYWGRPTELTVVRGPWSALVSRYLGKDVLLCRVGPPGGVVWGGPVSVVTTSSLAEVARRTGRDPGGEDGRGDGEDGRRFRATFVVDTGEAPAFVEDEWTGRSLRLGDAVVRVRGPLERCALVDRRPEAGGRDAMVLRALAADRRIDGQIVFGVHADVVRPGTVRLGAEVAVEATDAADAVDAAADQR